MSLYNNKKDYEELVKENIFKANLLHGLSEKNKIKILNLLKQKEKIIEKNGLFANLQLKILNKKIEKIKLSSR